MSGSSLFTLGFVRPPDLPTNAFAFFEAAFGLGLLGLLIAYLPTIYSAFSRREVHVAQLEVRAGTPPTGVDLLVRAQQMERFHLLDDLWTNWQEWFSELEETHTSIGVLSFFRSPVAHRSWITASGGGARRRVARLSAVDLGFAPEAGICVRAGFFAAARHLRLLRDAVRPRSAPRRSHQHHPRRVRRGVRHEIAAGIRCATTATRPGSTSPAGG